MKLRNERLQEQREVGLSLIKFGKLPYSSYYDLIDQEPSTIEEAAEEALLVEEDVRPSVPRPRASSSGGPGESLDVWACTFAPQPHDYLAWSCGHGMLRILHVSSSSWSTTKGTRPIEVDISEPIMSLAFGSTTPTSPMLALNGMRAHTRSVYHRFHFGANQLILAVGLASGRIRIYDPVEVVFLFALFDHAGPIRDLKFTRDGSLQLCSTSTDSTLKLWNMYDDGNMYMTLHGHSGIVYGCDWSPVANLLCSVGASLEAIIWSTETYKIVHKLKGTKIFS